MEERLVDGTRKFEHLIATTAPSTAKNPKEKTFTSALNSALESIANEQPRWGLTTAALLNKVSEVPYFPEGQPPMLFDRRGGIAADRIVLHPIRKTASCFATDRSGIHREGATDVKPMMEGLSPADADTGETLALVTAAQTKADSGVVVQLPTREKTEHGERAFGEPNVKETMNGEPSETQIS